MAINHPRGKNELLHRPREVDAFTLAAAAIVIFIAFYFVMGGLRSTSRIHPGKSPSRFSQSTMAAGESLKRLNQPLAPSFPAAAFADSVSYPYEKFTLTQGPHGASYGHMAIDLAAGAGAAIRSPISGQITALFLDEIGNPTLVIENDIYTVTMLHGAYTVYIGQRVEQGQAVGSESNTGNTTDLLGRSCSGRNCGHHTHLNIFDKRVGASVNPLKVLGN